MEATTGALKLGRVLVGHQKAAEVFCFTFMRSLTSFMRIQSHVNKSKRQFFELQYVNQAKRRNLPNPLQRLQMFFSDDPYPHLHILSAFGNGTPLLLFYYLKG